MTMLDDPEYRIPPDFAAWTNDQREDWAFDPDPLMHEQRWRKDVVRDYNATHASVVVTAPEDRPHVFRYEETQPSYDEKGEPLPCPLESGRGHWREACPRCIARRRWAQEVADAYEAEKAAAIVGDPSLRGAAIFDAPTSSPIWGTGTRALTAAGQGTMLVGRDGAGKTTVSAQYAKSRAGLGTFGGQLLGLPVETLPEGQRVVYFAVDRPFNALDRIRAGLPRTAAMEVELNRRLTVYPEPPKYDLSREAGQRWLLNYLAREDAGLVVLDSRKDLGDPNDDKHSIGIMAMEKMVTAAGVEVFINHHPVQAYDGGTPALEHTFGRRWVFAGMGSILFLTGNGSSPKMKLRQVKAPFGEMVSIDIEHDLITGTTRELQRFQIARGPSPMDVLRSYADPVTGWASATDLSRAFGDKAVKVLGPLLVQGIVQSNGGRSKNSAYREVRR